MALLDVNLLRGVLLFPGDDAATASTNLRMLRHEVNPEGVDAHLLRFIGDLTDRSSAVPDFALVKGHYDGLVLKGDSNGLAGSIRLADVETSGVVQPTVAQFRHQLDQFREAFLNDHIGLLLQQAGTIITSGYTPPPTPKNRTPAVLKGSADALQFLQQGLGAIGAHFRAGDVEGTMRDLRDVFVRYQQRMGKPQVGVPTGFKEIDSVHYGIKPGDLALILGYTSQMKSTLLYNIIYHAAIWSGHNCALVSMETSAKALQDTILVMHCSHAKFEAQFGPMVTVTYDRLVQGQLSPSEERLVQAAIDDMATDPSYGQILYKEPESDQTVGQIKQWAEEQDRTVCPIDVIGIDYLGLVNPSDGGISMAESAVANRAIREAKQLAMTFRQSRGVGVISPFQSNREGFKAAVKAGGRYELTALAWAPEAERSSDLVYSVFLNDSLRAARQLQVGNLKARDRRLITDPITLMADPNMRIIEGFDPNRLWQAAVNIGSQP